MHIKLTNGTPAKYTLGQLRRDNPNTSFPSVIPDALLASYDVYPYVVQDATFDPLTQNCVEKPLSQVNGQWVLPMVAQNKPQDEVERHIRSMRDELLLSTDWVVIKSYEHNESMSADWEAYRQALRDITTQSGFPYSVTWPTPSA
tara:strand:+ start:4668 stop:5102 length:435 start_codon:yes stop_codon:yes gene_type:complete